MNTFILETERLIMHPFTKGDLARLIMLRSDEDVIKYLGGRIMQNPTALKTRLDFYVGCHEKYGFGMCSMVWKETGEIIGWSGLMPLGETEEIEVGYGMTKEFWGRGIGFECAGAWLEYGFKTAELERIVAVASPENVGSWRIMEKCGMKRGNNQEHYGMECVYYSITREEFWNRAI